MNLRKKIFLLLGSVVIFFGLGIMAAELQNKILGHPKTLSQKKQAEQIAGAEKALEEKKEGHINQNKEDPTKESQNDGKKGAEDKNKQIEKTGKKNSSSIDNEPEEDPNDIIEDPEAEGLE